MVRLGGVVVLKNLIHKKGKVAVTKENPNPPHCWEMSKEGDLVCSCIPWIENFLS